MEVLWLEWQCDNIHSWMFYIVKEISVVFNWNAETVVAEWIAFSDDANLSLELLEEFKRKVGSLLTVFCLYPDYFVFIPFMFTWLVILISPVSYNYKQFVVYGLLEPNCWVNLKPGLLLHNWLLWSQVKVGPERIWKLCYFYKDHASSPPKLFILFKSVFPKIDHQLFYVVCDRWVLLVWWRLSYLHIFTRICSWVVGLS